MNTVILAVFIASTGFFQAAVPVAGALQQEQFPNSEEGIAQLDRWIEDSGVTAFDYVCVTGPTIEMTPALRFWSTRKWPVFFMPYAQMEEYMLKRKLPQASARVLLSACSALAPK